MDREEARQRIQVSARSYFKKDASGKGYICPICGSGSGKKGTGITTKDGIHFTCWGGACFRNADIIDILGIEAGITDYNSKLLHAASILGIEIDQTRSRIQPEDQSRSRSKQEKENQVSRSTRPEVEPDYREYFRECAARLDQTDYISRRGIGRETAARFCLGYDPAWRHPKAPAAVPTSPRLIIPTGKGSYIARDTRSNLSEDLKQYAKQKVRYAGLFNVRALADSSKPVFVVEGELDAISIAEVGGAAVALGSIVNRERLIKYLEANPPRQPLIIALDNDDPGQRTAEKLAADLDLLRVTYYRINLYGEHKDANEALTSDRAYFADAVASAENIELEAEREAYLKTSAGAHLQEFIDGIANSVNTPAIPTGFKRLDGVLDGGLYEGLYVFGAISSLGKTTLVTQIADQVAQGGHDVILFSLEMARSELMAKSISRHTFLDVTANGGPVGIAKTTRGITTGSRYARYSQDEQETIERAITEYSRYSERIFILEGIGNLGTEQIRETVRKHILFTGRSPVIVVDYVQILAPADIRATDKQNIDKSVLELKRISRDFKIPVLGISSFNRANYSVAVTMEAFKESGSLEYGSDVLIGLQLQGAGVKNFDVNTAKQKDPREVEAVILKNRNGATGGKILFEYYPKFNYFREA